MQFEEFAGGVEDVKQDVDLPPPPEYKVEQLIPDRPQFPNPLPKLVPKPPAKGKKEYIHIIKPLIESRKL